MRVVDFLRQVKLEVSRVVWPSRRETVVTTVGVCFLIGLLSALLLLVDWGLGSAVAFVLNLGHG